MRPVPDSTGDDCANHLDLRSRSGGGSRSPGRTDSGARAEPPNDRAAAATPLDDETLVASFTSRYTSAELRVINIGVLHSSSTEA
jgi:hypothetical protein